MSDERRVPGAGNGPVGSGPVGNGLGEDVLSAYLDDELDSVTRAEVDARLADSAQWWAILADVRAARDAVRALPVRQAPAGFWDRVMEAAADEPAFAPAAPVATLDGRRAARRAAGARPRARWTALAGAAAAAVVVAVIAVPAREQTRPPVASFTNAHAARSSLSGDAVTQLAGLGSAVNQR